MFFRICVPAFTVLFATQALSESTKPELTTKQLRLCGLQFVELTMAQIAIEMTGLEPTEGYGEMEAFTGELKQRTPADYVEDEPQQTEVDAATMKLQMYQGMIIGATDKQAAVDRIYSQAFTPAQKCLE